MRLALLILIAAANLCAWPNGYTYRRTITIDHTKIPNTDQANFPVLICFNGASSTPCDVANSNTALPGLKTVGNGGKVVNTVTGTSPYSRTICADCIITDSSSNILSFEIDNYSASTGAVNFWVKIPTLSHTADTLLYIYYGNGSVTTDQSATNATWSAAGFKAVFHGQAIANPNNSFNDAAALTVSGTVTDTTGQIGGGWQSDGTAGNFVQANNSTNAGDIDQTYLIWALMTSIPAGQNEAFQCGANFATGAFYAGSLGSATNSLEGGQASNAVTSASFWTTNTWHRIAVSYKTSTPVTTLYADGASLGTNGARFTGSCDRDDMLTYIGLLGWTGKVDEYNRANALLSADWIATDFNNQSSPNTFYALGPEDAGVGIPRRGAGIIQ